MNKEEQIIRHCARCGKVIFRLYGFEKYAWRRHHKIYCSYSCYNGSKPTDFSKLYDETGHRRGSE